MTVFAPVNVLICANMVDAERIFDRLAVPRPMRRRFWVKITDNPHTFDNLRGVRLTEGSRVVIDRWPTKGAARVRADLMLRGWDGETFETVPS